MRKYKLEIEGLRGLSIISVFIYHLNENFMPSGFLGVDIFFILSGYLITLSLEKYKDQNLIDYLKRFYKKRIMRVYPSLILFVLFISILIIFFVPNPKWILRSGTSSLFGLSNIFFYLRSTDYFAESTSLNPFTNTWSLGIEIQFYLVFPLIIWFSGFRNKGIIGNKKLSFITILITFLSLLYFIFLNVLNPSAAYFLPFSRLWELTFGSLIYQYNNKFDRIKNLPTLPALICLGLIFFLPQSFTSIKTILLVLITGQIIFCIHKNSFTYKILTNRILLHFGKLSYSIYLWHWGIFSLFRWTFGFKWFVLPFQFFIIYFISFLNYKYIEVKFKSTNLSRDFFKGYFMLILPFTMVNFYPLNNLILKVYSGKNINLELEKIPNDQKRLIIKKSNNFSRTLYAIGDSHNYHLYPLFKDLREKYDFSLYLHNWGQGIEGLKVNPYDPEYLSKNRYKKMLLNVFDYHNDKYLPKDLIIISINTLNKNNQANLNYKEKEVFELITKSAKRKDLNVILINQTPIFDVNKYQLCLKEWFRPEFSIRKNCLTAKRKVLQQKVYKTNKFFNYLAQTNNNVYLFNAFDILCPKEKLICNVTKDKKFVFADRTHLTPFGATLLSEEFSKFLKRNNLLK